VFQTYMFLLLPVPDEVAVAQRFAMILLRQLSQRWLRILFVLASEWATSSWCRLGVGVPNLYWAAWFHSLAPQLQSVQLPRGLQRSSSGGCFIQNSEMRTALSAEGCPLWRDAGPSEVRQDAAELRDGVLEAGRKAATLGSAHGYLMKRRLIYIKNWRRTLFLRGCVRVYTMNWRR
jgi:hypothetical protein